MKVNRNLVEIILGCLVFHQGRILIDSEKNQTKDNRATLCFCFFHTKYLKEIGEEIYH
ncbi:hypothetical protein SAFG77S_11272 [Streptomyces afghaniensis]